MRHWTRRATLPRALSLATVAVLAACTAAGCGDDGASAGSATTAGSSGGKGHALKIAVLVDITGNNLSGEQRAPAVLAAWVKAKNAAGGVAGHPVELQIDDTKGDATTAAAAGAKVAADTSIVAAISLDANAEGLYAKKLVAAGVPVIGGMGFDPTVWGAVPNWWSVTTNFPAVIDSAMVLGKSVGAKKTSYAVCAEVATCAGIGQLAEGVTKKLGLSYGGTIKLAAASPNYTAQCLSIKKDGIDFVALGHSAQVDLRFAKDCKTQGYTGGLGMTSGSIESQVLEANDPGIKLDLAFSAFPWFASQPAAAAYRKLMQAQKVSEDDWADPHGTASYATLELFAKTIEANRASLPAVPTRADVVKAYGSVKDETLGGLLPQPLTFTAGKPAPLVTCYWLGSFDHGTFAGDGLDKPTCDPTQLQPKRG
jgi:branched-chain amino acid transport system substrate-binding protein